MAIMRTTKLEKLDDPAHGFIVGQIWRAANGRTVRITRVVPSGTFPIHGSVEGSHENGAWRSDGRHAISEWSLVRLLKPGEIPENHPLEEWFGGV
jgi:hypothetical protein